MSNEHSLISLFWMSQGPSEAPQNQLEVKRTSLEFNFRKFCQKYQKDLQQSGSIIYVTVKQWFT